MTSAEIIERLRMAMEGSRELDAMVAEALGVAWSPDEDGNYGPYGIMPRRVQFTRSLDAITAEIKARGGEWTVKDFNDRPPFVQAWMPGMGAEGKGITPPIALCVALLLAIA